MFQSNNTMRHIFLLLLAISLLFSFCSAESINIENVKEATDEELKTAYEIIVAEQKSRIKASLQFPEKEVSIGIGKTIKLEPVASDIPEGEAETACEWVSSNTEIATVKNGTVKGISTGKCIISCRKTYTSGLTIKDACIVSVDVPIKKITLPKAITIGVKKTVKLDVKYSPDKATNAGFSYTSSDLNVAKVKQKR